MTEHAVDYKNDIDFETIRRSFSVLSFNPEGVATRYQEDHARHLNSVREFFKDAVVGREEEWEADFERYRAGYIKHGLAFLAANGRCASAYVVGPAKFPVARNEKAMATAQKRLDECDAWSEKVLAKLKKKYLAQEETIISGLDPDALAKLQAKLAKEEAEHEEMLEANKVAREEGKLAPYQPFSLANSNARIRQIKRRITAMEIRAKAADQFQDLHGEYKGLAWHVYVADGRVCVKFSGKPDAEMLQALRKRAFKWSPTRGCHVRQLTGNAMWAIKDILGVSK